jgi:hypothetical protein
MKQQISQYRLMDDLKASKDCVQNKNVWNDKRYLQKPMFSSRPSHAW